MAHTKKFFRATARSRQKFYDLKFSDCLHPACRALISVWFLVFVSYSSATLAQSAPATINASSDQTLFLSQLKAGRKAAESDTALSDADKQKTLTMYDQAAQWLQQTMQTKAQVAQLQVRVQQAPQRIDAIRAGNVQSVQGLPDIAPALASGNLEIIQSALTEEQLALQRAREAQRMQADQLAQLLVGSKGLGEEISEKTKALEQVEAELEAPVTNEPTTLGQARPLLLKSRRMLRQSELELLTLRLGSHELLINLAQTERDLAAAEVAVRQSRFEALNIALQELSEVKARQARQEAEALKATTETLPAALQVIAKENAGYRQELEALVRREQALSSDLLAARLGLDKIKNDFEHTRQRVDFVGASEAIGKMLVRRRAELPSLLEYRRTSAERRAETSRATDRQVEIDELLREQDDIRGVVARSLEALAETERSQYRQDAENLAKARRDALNDLQKAYGGYIGQTTALDLADRQLVEVASAYVDYIDDQLIWIPGRRIATLSDPLGFGQAVAWLMAPGHWAEVARDVLNSVRSRPLWILLILVLFVALLKKRKRANEQLGEIARDTRKISSDSFKLTLLGLLHTLTIVGAWPLMLIGSGWLLGTLPTASLNTLALADGLIKAGGILFSIRFLIQICLPDGLGERHLRWPSPVCESVVREFTWLLPFAMPLGFVVAATFDNELPPSVQMLGQLAFIVIMLVSGVFVYRLLRRSAPLVQTASNAKGVRLLAQLRFLWFPPLVLLPLALAATTSLGYHRAAMHLEQFAEQTFWFFVGLFLVKELLLRSLYIAERRLRLEDALRRREEIRAQRAQGLEVEEEEPSPVSLDVPELDYDELSEQTKRLVRAGFLFVAVIGIWNIWSDLLPTLDFLNTKELPFSASRIVDGIAKEVPVTLADLILGLFMVVITVLAAKNIPGVLEIALLQRLPLDAGARYAITSLTQYAIVGMGVVVAVGTLGLQWSNIQWLVAALGVGLGFGLQEIVANFISGIILLFERPIRVGDVVTIDNISGAVSRIRIRATTITNWDKQELLIPNKEFITGRVINWTLTDTTNRIIVPVGVAYGTDVQKAMDLMLEAASENENVLNDPKSVVSFDAFGDNSLTLQLRSYLGSMDNRLATITALHRAINDKFAAAGINIAFPQRDVHLATDNPLDVRIHSSPPGEPPTPGTST